MSVRLFAGYFLALAACAIVAFGSSDPEPAVPPFSAEAGMMPLGFSPDRAAFPAAPFSLRPHKIMVKIAPKRVQVADAR